jgi:hypothetical protein
MEMACIAEPELTRNQHASTCNLASRAALARRTRSRCDRLRRPQTLSGVRAAGPPVLAGKRRRLPFLEGRHATFVAACVKRRAMRAQQQKREEREQRQQEK